jgi:hypothetical protein
MKAIVGVRGLLGITEKVNGVVFSSLCCDHCREKLGFHVHRYWHMRFCCAACVNAYQQRLSPDAQQKIYEIDGRRPSWKAARLNRLTAEVPALDQDPTIAITYLGARAQRLRYPAPSCAAGAIGAACASCRGASRAPRLPLYRAGSRLSCVAICRGSQPYRVRRPPSDCRGPGRAPAASSSFP